MTRRLIVLAVGFLATAGYVAFAMEPERVPLREPLAAFPYGVGEWSGQDAPQLADDVLAVLGVDEYINRYYAQPDGALAGLYVGYYQSQRQGDTIHSPMNCLPGAGWQPVVTGRADIQVAGRTTPIQVNDVVIEKGLDRQVVFYWYQSQGRVVASEYWSKIYLVADAIRFHRSDAALVRVVVPVPASGSLEAARQQAREFVRAMFPLLSDHLPA